MSKAHLKILTSEQFERIKRAITDEAGSRLCAWSTDGMTRHCTAVSPTKTCICENVARAAIAAI